MRNYFIRLASLSLVLSIVGCASARKIIGPDRTPNILVSCMDPEYCYEKAREVCRGNYKIINSNSDSSGSNGITSSTISLLIKCERSIQ